MTALGPGYYAPYATVTDTDHSAWIIIAAALGLTLILFFSVLRIAIAVTIRNALGFDDAFLAAAAFCAAIQSSIILGACAAGLGKSVEILSAYDLLRVEKMYYASNLFFVMAIGFSKISVAFLLLRMTPKRGHMVASQVIAGLVGVWTFASTIAVALQCKLSHPWIMNGENCPGVGLRWEIVSSIDIISELLLVGMTIYLVWGLQTSFENKATVVVAFGMRLPLIVAIGFRLSTFDSAGLTTDFTILEDTYIVWTQTELWYSVVSAVIPGLRKYVKSLATNYGNPMNNGAGSYGAGSYAVGSSTDTSKHTEQVDFELSSLRPKADADRYKYRIWVPENGQGSSSVAASAAAGSATKGDSASIESNDSKRLIIKKGLTWEVVDEKSSVVDES